MLNAYNHDLKFKFKKSTKNTYDVSVGQFHLGSVVKVANPAFDAFDTNGKNIGTRVGQGARKAASEMLAHKAGLLDGNYNAI